MYCILYMYTNVSISVWMIMDAIYTCGYDIQVYIRIAYSQIERGSVDSKGVVAQRPKGDTARQLCGKQVSSTLTKELISWSVLIFHAGVRYQHCIGPTKDSATPRGEDGRGTRASPVRPSTLDARLSCHDRPEAGRLGASTGCGVGRTRGTACLHSGIMPERAVIFSSLSDFRFAGILTYIFNRNAR